MRSKAFFVNGGAGRVISSIPAFEKYAETHDDFVIICEGGTDFFKGHPTLDGKVYDNWHKNLFQTELKDRDIVSTEPYRVWEYYNQKCSLAQAYDMEINGLEEPRELPAPNLKVTKYEGISALQTIEGIKGQCGKDKVVVVQPFGRGVMNTDGYIFDPTSRSFNVTDIAEIINDLKKDYTVIVMTEFPFDCGKSKYNHAVPEVPDIRLWAALIECADHFVGCDSVGQHIAKAVGTTSTVVVGSTYPINISYPDDKDVDIIDLGEDRRTFSPIRLTTEDQQDMYNDECMTMTKDDIKNVLSSCRKRLGKSKDIPIVKPPEQQQEKSCCDNSTPKGFKS